MPTPTFSEFYNCRKISKYRLMKNDSVITYLYFNFKFKKKILF